MKRTEFSEAQIACALRQAEICIARADLDGRSVNHAF